MRGIYKRGNRYKWEIMYEGKRRYGYAATEEEATQARETALKEMKTVIGYSPSDPSTLGGMVTQMLNTHWSKENCKSHEWFERNTRLLMTYWPPETPLAEITSADISDYVVYLRDERNSSNGTINRKLAALSKLLHVAEEQGLINKRPVIHRQKEKQGRLRFLSHEEEDQMLLYFAKNFEALPLNAVTVLLDTGIRCGELQKLTVADVDWSSGKNGIITCRDTKNSETRAVPLTSRAAKAVEILTAFSNDLVHLVPQERDWLRAPWNRMKHALGLDNDEEFVPHCLRHTCASRLVQLGVPIYTVSKWLGHKSINTTRRYAHLRPEDLYNAADLLG